MAFPTTGVLDNFNRASIGSDWTEDIYDFGDANFAISSNQASPGNIYYSSAWWNVETFGADSEVYVTIATLPGAGEGIGLGIRYADVGTNGVDGYNIYYEKASGTDTVIIMRLDDGSDTQLGATISQDFSAGDGIGVEAISSQIIVYRRSSGTWSDISSGGRTDGTYT